jgi:general nucleoside transport system permease protein
LAYIALTRRAQSEEEILDAAFLITLTTAVLAATWRLATPLIYAAIGEVFAERSGVLNIGLEGIMLFGAFTGFTVAYYVHSYEIGLLAAIVIGILVGLLFAFFVVTIKANQIVVGAALNMIGMGMTGFLYSETTGLENCEIPENPGRSYS